MRGTHTPNLVIPGQFVPNILSGKHFYDEYTNLRGAYTSNLGIPCRFVPSILSGKQIILDGCMHTQTDTHTDEKHFYIPHHTLCGRIFRMWMILTYFSRALGRFPKISFPDLNLAHSATSIL